MRSGARAVRRASWEMSALKPFSSSQERVRSLRRPCPWKDAGVLALQYIGISQALQHRDLRARIRGTSQTLEFL